MSQKLRTLKKSFQNSSILSNLTKLQQQTRKSVDFYQHITVDSTMREVSETRAQFRNQFLIIINSHFFSIHVTWYSVVVIKSQRHRIVVSFFRDPKFFATIIFFRSSEIFCQSGIQKIFIRSCLVSRLHIWMRESSTTETIGGKRVEMLRSRNRIGLTILQNQ